MANQPKGGGESAADKIQKMISDAIDAKFGERDQREKEGKDPWAKLEGMIGRAVDAAVAKRFDVFAQGLEDEASDDDKDDKGDKGDKGSGLFGIPGLG